jgi:excinuclease UvrABC ATPase subunit
MWREIESISRELTVPDPKTTEFIRVSSTYGRIKAEIIEQMCRAIVISQQAGAKDPRVAAAIASYDRLWDEWRKLLADHPQSCATLYTDKAFGERPGMGAAIDKLRKP